MADSHWYVTMTVQSSKYSACIYGVIRNQNTTPPVWGDTIGHVEGYSALYAVPLVAYGTNGRFITSFMLDGSGYLKYYGTSDDNLTSTIENLHFTQMLIPGCLS